MSETRVGSYVLEAPLGMGATGRVWRARSEPGGARIALKLLGTAGPDLRVLRREMRAMARLSHPAIARVHELGVLGDAIDDGFGGRARAGSGWLAMELAPRGTLREASAPASYAELHALLDSLLAGLAHAHARGIVHRDLKPSNVLLAANGAPKLADFGLAMAYREASWARDASPRGTPGYMAPERILGAIADEGPWSDLYALGCVAWWLCTGERPFSADDPLALSQAHVNDPLPALRPRFAVPEQLPSWLARLLAKHWRDRPETAADARAALPDPSLPLTLEASLEVPALMRPEWPSTRSMGSSGVSAIEARPPRSEPPSRASSQPPPSLARAMTSGTSPLIEPALVGREVELRAIADAIAEVRAGGGARAMLVEGLAGMGKSRLVREACERASEAGEASVLWIDVSDLRDPSTAVIEAQLGGSIPHGPAPFGERAAHALRALRARGAQRPTVLVLDDAHRSARALDLAHHVAGSAATVLAIVVVDEEALARRASAGEAQRRLLAHPRTSRVRVGPLDPAACAAIAAAMGASPHDAASLDGSPLRLVESLRARDATTGAAQAGSFERRIRAVLASLHLEPEPALLTLELAATLGLEPERDVLDRACAIADAPELSDDLVEALADARILHVDREGSVRLAHEEQRAALLARAAAAGRAEDWHRAAASALDGTSADAASARAAEHLALAGLAGRASARILEAIEERLEANDVDRAERLHGHLVAAGAGELPRVQLMRARLALARGALEEAERALAVLDGADTDERTRASGELCRGMLLHKRGLMGAPAHFARARALFARLGDARGEAEAVHGLAESTKWEGRVSEALPLYRDACDRFAALGEPMRFARGMSAMADALRRAGKRDEAEAALRAAVPYVESGGAMQLLALTHNVLGDLALERGDTETADEAFRRAAALLDDLGSSDAVIPRLNRCMVALREARWDDVLGALPALERECERSGRVGFTMFVYAMGALAHASRGELEAAARSLATLSERLAGPRDDELCDLLDRTARAAEERGASDVARLARSLR